MTVSSNRHAFSHVQSKMRSRVNRVRAGAILLECSLISIGCRLAWSSLVCASFVSIPMYLRSRRSCSTPRNTKSSLRIQKILIPCWSTWRGATSPSRTSTRTARQLRTRRSWCSSMPSSTRSKSTPPRWKCWTWWFWVGRTRLQHKKRLLSASIAGLHRQLHIFVTNGNPHVSDGVIQSLSDWQNIQH